MTKWFPDATWAPVSCGLGVWQTTQIFYGTLALQRTLQRLCSRISARAKIEQLRTSRGGRKSQGILQTPWSTSSPCRDSAVWLNNVHPCADGCRSLTRGTPSSSKSCKKTSSFREWPASFKPRIHPFAGMCHNPALDPFKLERSAARLSHFAGAFLSVFRVVLV